ncbi:cell wall-binding repeat-containing protein [Herbiconiux daphne]|uniref:Cell wall-binding repeat-containing protein n=1 Tax=Herbiconiux daphne TaxID=2970914 RepID=A0ABT2H1E5_9MICO|nr:cell wall-binding repeat-containing protein [Herbiconiux daphne]MCS5733730.1 cell wall-binding repeat-containing protein [Herbiconiux daphne]
MPSGRSRLLSSCIAAAALVAGAVAPAAVTSASAAAAAVAVAAAAAAEGLVPAPVCPQEQAIVGFPITPKNFIERPPVGLPYTISLSGALPDGLRVVSQPNAPVALGVPTTSQRSTFTVVAVFRKGDGTTETSSTDCTTVVQPSPVVNRIAGIDRYDQSVEVSRAGFSAASVVYLASGEKFADALSASAVAAEHHAPLLLTPAAGISSGVIGEIARLKPADVVVVGGPASVSPAALSQLGTATAATITRIDGADRYAVSRNLIAHPAFGIPRADDVYLATGANFPDALTASPAAAQSGAPVLLVNGAESSLTGEESSTLARLGAENAFIVGGENSVSKALQTQLETSYTTTRFGGADRFEVSHTVNDAVFPAADDVYLASGTAFADALSGGVVAGLAGDPLYLTRQTCIDAGAASGIGRLLPHSLFVLGGTATLDGEIDALTICPAE